KAGRPAYGSKAGPETRAHRVFDGRSLPFSEKNGTSWDIIEGSPKAFPIQEDEHLLTVLRYIERNPLRAGLVERAEAWRWSSLWWLEAPERALVRLELGAVARGRRWIEGVNAATADIEDEGMREAIRRDLTYGSDTWTRATARQMGLGYSLRARGRPRPV